MDELKVGAMCAGYGGLELGLSYAGFDFQLEWVAESDKWASLVLEERFGVPNLGDLTEIKNPPAVDVCIAGFPCQPVSHAGTQQGIKDERWLIDDVVRVANAAGARWLFLENVLGIYTANQGNAFGQVLASLAKGGFDARWKSVRADESCGAPHRRNRWFCIAYSSESEIDSKGSSADSDSGSYDEERRGRCGGLFGAQEEGKGEGKERQRVWSISSDGFKVIADSTDFGYEWSGGKGSGWDGFENSSVASANSDNGGRSLLREKDRVLEEREGETHNVTGSSSVIADSDESGSQGEESEGRRHMSTWSIGAACDWGQYESAIRRWEQAFGCVAPHPTEPSRSGGTRLSPVFVEWMMGLPEGWVTGLDIPRTHQLKLLGNGVVPQQAAVAYLELLGVV